MKLKLSDVLDAARVARSHAGDEEVITADTVASVFAEEAKTDAERRLWDAAYFYLARKPEWRTDEDIVLPEEFNS
jgi:hypothetical protein